MDCGKPSIIHDINRRVILAKEKRRLNNFQGLSPKRQVLFFFRKKPWYSGRILFKRENNLNHSMSPGNIEPQKVFSVIRF